MRFILLLLVYMAIVDCVERCRHPQAEDGHQIFEGCLLRTCKAGVWRTSLAGNLCCYERTAYTINTTISSSMSKDGCVKADIDCVEEIPGQAKMILSMKNYCEEYATQEQIEEIKELLVRQREAGVGCQGGDEEGEEKEDSKALLIGPGIGAWDFDTHSSSVFPNSVVLSLPDLKPLNCNIPIIPSPCEMDDCPWYMGYMGRYTNDGLHMCGGRINGEETSSCYLVTTEGLKDMPGLLKKRANSASIMTPHGWWVTGGYYDYDYGYEDSEDFSLQTSAITTELWSNNQWQEHVRLPVMMSSHCMTWVNQSHILLTGGIIGDDEYSAASYLYSEETGFTRIADMKTRRSNHGCSLINESLVFVAGGNKGSNRNSTEYLDLATLTWFDGPELPGDVGYATMTGDILVGGKKKIFKLEKLGLSVGQWQWAEIGELEDPRSHFQAFEISDKFCN